MKVLVVGGAGYIGSVLVRELLERGYAVSVFDRLFFGEQGLADVKDRIELIVGDMRTIDMQAFEGVDAMINLGGLSNDPTAEYNPRANQEMNTVAAFALAQACKAQGVQRYLYASSASVYDVGVGTEEKDVVLDEGAAVRPRAAYSSSKHQAERLILPLADDSFCPVVLRKGTLYGFSPRMRYDLVVNTFVKDALARGSMTLFFGGEMWRPLLSVTDAARAYIACLEAPEERVRGQVFNVVYQNFRISELALRVKEALRGVGVQAEIQSDYTYRGVRNYRVSGEKLGRTLGFRPIVGVEEAVEEMVLKIRQFGYTDFDHPRYYNIGWFQLLEEAHRIIDISGSVFEAPQREQGTVVPFSLAGQQGESDEPTDVAGR